MADCCSVAFKRCDPAGSEVIGVLDASAGSVSYFNLDGTAYVGDPSLLVDCSSSGAVSVLTSTTNDDGDIVITHNPGDGSTPTQVVVPAPCCHVSNVLVNCVTGDPVVVVIDTDDQTSQCFDENGTEITCPSLCAPGGGGGGGGSVSSLVTVSNADGSTTVTHNAGDGSTPTSFTIPAATTDTNSVSQLVSVVNADSSITVTHTPGDGSTPYVFTIPPPGNGGGTTTTSAFNLVNNADGSTTITHNAGDGSATQTFTIPAPPTGGTGSTSAFGLVNNANGSTTITHDPGDGTGVDTFTIPAPTASGDVCDAIGDFPTGTPVSVVGLDAAGDCVVGSPDTTVPTGIVLDAQNTAPGGDAQNNAAWNNRLATVPAASSPLGTDITIFNVEGDGVIFGRRGTDNAGNPQWILFQGII